MNKSKKIKIVAVLIATMTIFTSQMIFATPDQHQSNDIRLRIIPHSDSEVDQMTKRVVRFAINEFFTTNQSELTSNEDTRNFLINNLDTINDKVERVLWSVGDDVKFEVSFGHHMFPESGRFDAGQYESLVIRIGDAGGDNWWCFVNPGICLTPGEETDVNHVQYNQQTNLRGFFSNLFGSGHGRMQDTSIDWYVFDDEK